MAHYINCSYTALSVDMLLWCLERRYQLVLLTRPTTFLQASIFAWLVLLQHSHLECDVTPSSKLPLQMWMDRSMSHAVFKSHELHLPMPDVGVMLRHECWGNIWICKKNSPGWVRPWLVPLRRYLQLSHTGVSASLRHRDSGLQETSIVTVGNSGKQGLSVFWWQEEVMDVSPFLFLRRVYFSHEHTL